MRVAHGRTATRPYVSHKRRINESPFPCTTHARRSGRDTAVLNTIVRCCFLTVMTVREFQNIAFFRVQSHDHACTKYVVRFRLFRGVAMFLFTRARTRFGGPVQLGPSVPLVGPCPGRWKGCGTKHRGGAALPGLAVVEVVEEVRRAIMVECVEHLIRDDAEFPKATRSMR